MNAGRDQGHPLDADSALCPVRALHPDGCKRHRRRGLVFRPVWNGGPRLRPKAPPDCAIYLPGA